MQEIIISFLIMQMTISTIAQTPNIRIKHFNTKKNITINGYDPVAYFTNNKAEKGNKIFAVNADGIIYYCSSQTNKDLLIKIPTKYEPQYGGWCAYAMGAKGDKVEIDPETFKFKDGKLFLFYNSTFKKNSLPLWNKDEIHLITNADENWSTIFLK